MTTSFPNRWGIAAAAVVMQICLGGVYGWSVFVQPLMDAEGWTLTEISLAFTLSIVFLGAGTVVGGLWQDRAGPRWVATVAGVAYGAGYLVAALSLTHHSLAGLYLGYGVLAGFGMGMGYITPVATLLKWFPDRRGLMTGVAVSGFGAGALVMGPLAALGIQALGIPATFATLGLVYLVLVVASAQFHANPPQGWRPEGWEPRSTVTRTANERDYTVREAMSTRRFWLLWMLLFLNVSAGIMIISQASPMAQQIAGMTPVAAAGVVGLISIFNSVGRVFWAWMSDVIGRARVFALLFLAQGVIFLLLPSLQQASLFVAAVALIGFCYGGGFGTMPSYTVDCFGLKHVGGVYGLILLAWAAASVPSPILIARVHQATGQYDTAIWTIAVVMLLALALHFTARPLNRAVRQPALQPR